VVERDAVDVIGCRRDDGSSGHGRQPRVRRGRRGRLGEHPRRADRPVHAGRAQRQPIGYRSGTTLDDQVEGTGPWILDSFDAPDVVATSRANPAWWGGSVKRSGIEFGGFGTESGALAALKSGEIDALQRVATASGRSLLGEAGFQMARIASSSHRQFWFNTRRGLFADRRLRSAIAWAVDRNGAIDDLNQGFGVIANDHPIHSDLGSVPFLDPNAVDQRARDIERSCAFLLDAGRRELSAVLHTNETPDAMAAAELVRSSVSPAGITVAVVSEPDEALNRETWCSLAESEPHCSESADFGIIENAHRLLPDVLLGRTWFEWGVERIELPRPRVRPAVASVSTKHQCRWPTVRDRRDSANCVDRYSIRHSMFRRRRDRLSLLGLRGRDIALWSGDTRRRVQVVTQAVRAGVGAR
jgi:hypothetical protein